MGKSRRSCFNYLIVTSRKVYKLGIVGFFMRSLKKSSLIGLAAIALTSSLSGRVLASEDEVQCASEEKVRYVAENIPRTFKEVRPFTYLIDSFPEAKNGYLGGQLVVYFPEQDNRGKIPGLPFPERDPAEMSIFDRIDINHLEWYNISNMDSSNIGCVDGGLIYLNQSVRNEDQSNPVKQIKAQLRFNDFVNRTYEKIQYKK